MKEKQPYISLLSDYGFKATFANEANTLFLRKSLQALIQSPTPIKEVVFSSNEFTGITQEARGGLSDLVCVDEENRTFIVEMQLGYYPHFMQRAKFYAFHKFHSLVKKGEYLFDDLTPIYCISILAKGIFSHSEEYYHFARLKNQKCEEIDEQMTHVFVEINKFNKSLDEIDTDLDKLIYVMKNLQDIRSVEELPLPLAEKWLEQAIEKLEKSQMTLDQRFHYEMMLAKNGSIIGMRKAEEKRRQEEVEKKLQQVTQEVADENSKNIAKIMKTAGEPIEKIMKYTGLSEAEIENI